MSPKEIKNALENPKKKLSGQELGIIEVEDMLLLLEASLNGDKEHKRLFNLADFCQKLKSLSKEQMAIYNGYVSIHTWFMKHYYHAAFVCSEAERCICSISKEANTTWIAEVSLIWSYISPKVVTDKQYQDMEKSGELPVKKGIAILRPEDEANQAINPHTGYYTTMAPEELLPPISLDSYLIEYEGREAKLRNRKSELKHFYEGYYFVKGWNKALDLTAERFDLEHLSIAKADLDGLIELAEDYETDRGSLIEAIKGAPVDYPNKRRKIYAAKKAFPELAPLSLIEQPEEDIEKAKANMEDFSAYKGNTDMVLSLCLGE